MLLSRVADSLYWISRYLERAAHTARLVEISTDLRLGRARDTGGAVDRLHAILGLPSAGDVAPCVALLDPSHRNSVVACITAARDNARQVREEISSDMWEHLNALFLRLRQTTGRELSIRPHAVCRIAIEGIHLFEGVTDATMGHGEAWHYLQAGRFLERGASTATLIDAFFTEGSQPGIIPPLDQAEWVALLRACCALEAYCRHYTADVRPGRIAEFLLLNAEFPRSVRFAAARLEAALLALARCTGRPVTGRAERLAGRLHASLDYGQVDEILDDDAHEYFAGIGRQCAQIHGALYQGYITYAIESALPA